jgi:hypothetical protein
VTAGFDHRRNSWLLIAATVAVCAAAPSKKVQAGCGDYLVGVESKSASADGMPMHPHDPVPGCRACNQPMTPTPPTVEIERRVVEPLPPKVDASPSLERGGWMLHDSPIAFVSVANTPDRPPK